MLFRLAGYKPRRPQHSSPREADGFADQLQHRAESEGPDHSLQSRDRLGTVARCVAKEISLFLREGSDKRVLENRPSGVAGKRGRSGTGCSSPIPLALTSTRRTRLVAARLTWESIGTIREHVLSGFRGCQQTISKRVEIGPLSASLIRFPRDGHLVVELF